MTFPDELRYTEEHEWLRLDDDGETATIGITDFAQRELGDIVYVELEPEGTEVEQDGIFGTVEAVKTVADLFMPVAGTILEINQALDSAPETVNEDPYGAGWMVRIRVADPASVEDLMDHRTYRAHVEG